MEAQDWEWDYNSFGFGHVEIAAVGDFPTDARRHLHMNLKFRGEVSDRDVWMIWLILKP